jgi:hypothetical protein
VYVLRVLLTGIQLLRTGIVEANLEVLNEEMRLPHVADLIARKRSGHEHGTIDNADLAHFESEYRRLLGELEAARDASPLPEAPSVRPALNDLLVRIRRRLGASAHLPPDAGRGTCTGDMR